MLLISQKTILIGNKINILRMNLTLREKSKNNELGYSKNKLTLFEHESIAAKQVEVLESQSDVKKKTCTNIFFSSCIENQKIQNSQKQSNHFLKAEHNPQIRLLEDIADKNQLSLNPFPKKTSHKKLSLSLKTRQTLKKNSNSKTKKPIQLSSCQSSKNNNQRYKSEENKNNYQTLHPKQKLILSNITSPKKLHTHGGQVQNCNKKLKESMKPSTYISSNENSSKKPIQKSNLKLSLSSNFKSMITTDLKKKDTFDRDNFQNKLVLTNSPYIKNRFSQNQIIVKQLKDFEDSFITQKYKRVGGQLTPFSSQQLKSNIQLCNRLINFESPEKQTFQSDHLNSIDYSEQYSHQKQSRDKNIKILDQGEQNHIEEVSDEADNDQLAFNFARSKLTGRRHIGQFAKTIKTFNESSSKSNDLSQEQSIVIERGIKEFINFDPIYRGSLRMQEPENKISDILTRRKYNSMSQYDNQNFNLSHTKPKVPIYIQNTIEENIYDEEKQI